MLMSRLCSIMFDKLLLPVFFNFDLILADYSSINYILVTR